jgi:hypothetical protein
MTAVKPGGLDPPPAMQAARFAEGRWREVFIA